MGEVITSARSMSRRTLIEEINNLADIYGFRNRFFMPDFNDRITWLLMGTKDLFEVVRKGRPQLTQQLAVARVFARIVAVDEYFRTGTQFLPFVRLLCQKYPHKGCSYCKRKPCMCPPNRDQSSDLDDSAFAVQKRWSLNDWQTHLGGVYGPVNQHNSWDRLFAHLTTEVIEILNVKYITTKLNQDELIRQYAKELADTFAWTCGVATKMDVQIGGAVELVYGRGCGVCRQPECKCGVHSYDFLDIDAFEQRYFNNGEVVMSMISSR